LFVELIICNAKEAAHFRSTVEWLWKLVVVVVVVGESVPLASRLFRDHLCSVAWLIAMAEYSSANRCLVTLEQGACGERARASERGSQ
jgi:hypothetical protein